MLWVREKGRMVEKVRDTGNVSIVVNGDTREESVLSTLNYRPRET